MARFIKIHVFTLCFVFFSNALLGSRQEVHNGTTCFTGTLLAEYAENIEPGDFAVESYFIFKRELGFYNAHSQLVKDRNNHIDYWLCSLETGITKNIDVSLYLSAYYSSAAGKTAFNYGDMILLFGFQLARDKKNCWVPDVRVQIGETFPTGKYDRLGLEMKYANATGTGSYETYMILIARKIYYTWPKHPYNWNFNFYYIAFSDVKVRGVSVYGGGPDTRGTVRPGQRLIANLAFEYKLDKKWALGLDLHYRHTNAANFYSPHPNLTPAGLPSSEIFSLIPQLEYCHKKLGVRAGWWFSAYGRNAIAFQNIITSIFYEF